MKVRIPNTVARATALLERHALLEGQVASAEARRSALLARANAAADAKVSPLLEELAALDAALAPWWESDGRAIAGKRKSVELGGCMIGTRLAKAKLGHDFVDDDAAVLALQGTRYARQAVRVKYTLDRTGTARLLDVGGKTSAALKELGFWMSEPEATFFVKGVEQQGTIG